jgi:hypothetical protein
MSQSHMNDEAVVSGLDLSREIASAQIHEIFGELQAELVTALFFRVRLRKHNRRRRVLQGVQSQLRHTVRNAAEG